MYKVIVVENEPIMRKGIVNFIDWKSLDCEIVGDFKDGLAAKKYLENPENIVDIVITDIKMPNMTGLELAEYLYNNKPEIKIIILTGFADFSYAQTAIKYGVIDFVTKVNPLELLVPAVKKAKQMLSDVAEKRDSINSLQSKLNDNMSAARKMVLQDIINRVIVDKNKIAEMLNKYSIHTGEYFLVLFKMDDYTSVSPESGYCSYNSFVSTITNCINMIFSKHRFYIMNLRYKLICLLIFFDNDSFDVNCGILRNSCNEIITVAANFTDSKFYIGISDMHSDLQELSYAYDEAETVLFKKDSSKRVRFYSDTVNQNNKKDALISKIIGYISENYTSDINLDAIARALHFNPIYISRVFKSKTGKTLTEYINEYRLEKSINFLLKTDMHLYEIAHQLGYNNASYFASLFKKYYGMTPHEYKNLYRN